MKFTFKDPPLVWREAYIPKPHKPGERRKLTIPNDELMSYQKDIHEYLKACKSLRASPFAHGFVTTRGCMTAVLKHDRMSPLIMGMDVRDFFDNFPLDAVRSRMLSRGIPADVTEHILKVCSYNGHLPQGGPCSPFLTNVGMYETDLCLYKLAKDRGMMFTRYADDLVYSVIPGGKSDTRDEDDRCRSHRDLFYAVDAILHSRLGLRLKRCKNHEIWLTGKEKRQVLGITIRKDGLGYNAPKGFRKKARAMVHNLFRKLKSQNGVPRDADWQKWMEVKGSVLYMDTCRAAGDSSCNGADPQIQEEYWQYLMEVFRCN